MAQGERSFSILPVEQRSSSGAVVWAQSVRLRDCEGDVYDIVILPSAVCQTHCWDIVNAWLSIADIPSGACCTYPKPAGELEFQRTGKTEPNGSLDGIPDWAENCEG